MTKRVISTTHNLPAAHERPIGRDDDALAIKKILLDRAIPLVTLTGPGGIGKTTLGLHVAGKMLTTFKDGVTFIDLTHVTDSGLILDQIVQILGIDQEPGLAPAQQLAGYFGRRHALLILDNFEHLLDGALFVTNLLQACPNLNILATSREPLRLQVEQVYPLSPLALPEANKTADPQALAHIAAVDLFLRRARAARPDFELTASNAADIAAIVVQLDGIPLAIQLAARIRLFSAEALRARLQESPLGLLTGGARDLPARQQTIRATIRWSNDLLMPPEARFFRRLGVFAGGFDLAAAEAVTTVPFADSDIDILSGVESLLDKRRNCTPVPPTFPKTTRRL